MLNSRPPTPSTPTPAFPSLHAPTTTLQGPHGAKRRGTSRPEAALAASQRPCCLLPASSKAPRPTSGRCWTRAGRDTAPGGPPAPASRLMSALGRLRLLNVPTYRYDSCGPCSYTGQRSWTETTGFRATAYENGDRIKRVPPPDPAVIFLRNLWQFSNLLLHFVRKMAEIRHFIRTVSIQLPDGWIVFSLPPACPSLHLGLKRPEASLQPRLLPSCLLPATRRRPGLIWA